MRKKLLAGVLALALLTGGTVLAYAGSQSESLISRSYLNETFWSGLTDLVRGRVEADTAPIYQEVLNRIPSSGGNGGGAGSGGFAAQAGKNGDVLSGTLGSGLIWTEGTCLVRSGSLVDATAGSEVAVGGSLIPGHRYLAGTDVTLTAASDGARWMAEGHWTVTDGDPVEPPAQLPFADVALGTWYYDDVVYVYQKGLFSGQSATEFAPGNPMMRCMMTTVLHRLAGEPPVGYVALFSDVPAGQWYTNGTIWAGQLGVVSGVGDGKFSPFTDVTRQEIAVFLYRYAQKLGRTLDTSADLSEFSDVSSVADWSRDAMSWAVGAKILNGSDGRLMPGGSASRAEVAAMLHRFVVWTSNA